MSKLDTSLRLADPDALFEALVEAHRDLDLEGSRRLDARLILLLANHVGDLDVVREAIQLAREAAEGTQADVQRHGPT